MTALLVLITRLAVLAALLAAATLAVLWVVEHRPPTAIAWLLPADTVDR